MLANTVIIEVVKAGAGTLVGIGFATVQLYPGASSSNMQ